MVLHRATPVGLLQLLFGRRAGHAQDFVVVAFAHRSSITGKRKPGTGERWQDIVPFRRHWFPINKKAAPEGRRRMITLLLLVVVDFGELGVDHVVVLRRRVRRRLPDPAALQPLRRTAPARLPPAPSTWLRSGPCRRPSSRSRARRSRLRRGRSRRPATLSPLSLIAVRAPWISASAWLRALTSSWNFLSSSRCASASVTMRWISSSDRPEPALISTFCSLPVFLSLADTCRMPLASMSNDDFDLRHAARRGVDAGQVELGQRLVVARLLAFALQHVHGHRGLVVLGGRERLRGLGRDRGVLLDDLGEHAAERLDAERQRGHVEQQHVLDVAGEHAALDRGADGDGFVRVDVLARFLAEELGHGLPAPWACASGRRRGSPR